MTATIVRGSDESHWQPPSLAFAQERKAAGDQFAILKATDGTSTDGSVAEHYRYMGEVGMARGPYHFYRASKDPIAMARFQVAKAYALGRWELPSTCDYENGGGADNPDDLYAYLCEVERLTGRTPILYTGPAFWTLTIGNDRRFARFLLWLARYLNKYRAGDVMPTSIEIPPPAPWGVLKFWQVTDSNGRLDRDVMAADTFAALTTAAAPVPKPRPTLQRGSVGQDVTAFAFELRFLGYKGFNISPSFGVGKWLATRRFQKNHHLPITGTVDQATWAALSKRVDEVHAEQAKAKAAG